MVWRMNIDDARWKPKSADPTIIRDETLAFFQESRLPVEEIATASFARDILQQPP